MSDPAASEVGPPEAQEEAEEQGGEAGSLPLLEEEIEPIEPEGPPDPLDHGTQLEGGDGGPVAVDRPLRTHGRSNLYQATMPDGAAVWLFETDTAEGGRRLHRHAEVAASVDCPMIPPVLASFETGGRTYLVTEPAEGPTLADAWSDGDLSLSALLNAVAQAAFAIAHLHEAGWAHLGVRPQVVVLGGTGGAGRGGRPARLLGLSNAVRIGEPVAAGCSEPGWSPPELARGGPATTGADVYGLGALLYRQVTGGPVPEEGLDLAALVDVHVAGVPQLLARCLGPPDTRYDSADELHRDLLRLRRRLEPSISYEVSGCTTIGLEPTRATNQDSWGWLAGVLQSEESTSAWGLAVVADGMGGMSGGEVASEAAVHTVLAEALAAMSSPEGPAPTAEVADQVAAVRRWAVAANSRVWRAMEGRGERGGSTLLCALLVGRRLAIAHVGDCRLYLCRPGEQIRLLTQDHSYAMTLVERGQLSRHAARDHPSRNLLERSLGANESLDDELVDTLAAVTGAPTLTLRGGDVLLAASDGLWDPLDDATLGEVVSGASDLDGAAGELVRLALEQAAPDNATVVLVRLREQRSPESAAG